LPVAESFFIGFWLIALSVAWAATTLLLLREPWTMTSKTPLGWLCAAANNDCGTAGASPAVAPDGTTSVTASASNARSRLPLPQNMLERCSPKRTQPRALLIVVVLPPMPQKRAGGT